VTQDTDAGRTIGVIPVIGVTAGTSKDGGAPIVGSAYLRALTAVGAAPVVLPNFEDPSLQSAWLTHLDGLLLTGGADVHPARYGEDVLNDTVHTDTARDAAELPLIREAFLRGMPILAICRGIQVLNVALGGSLYQDLPSQLPSSVAHRQCHARSVCTHSIRIRGGTALEDLLGASRVPVNSFHHQAIRKLAQPLEAVAWAEDGVIEGVEAPSASFVVGVQFHPEDLIDTRPEARSLFHGFAAAARAWSANSLTTPQPIAHAE